MKELIIDMWQDGVGKLLLAVIAVLLLMIPLAIYGTIQEEKKWQAFKVANNCKIVGHEKGHTSTGIGFGMMPNGQMGTVMTTSSTPDKTGWACDDGVTYWR